MPFHERGLAIPGKLDRWIGRSKADDGEEDYSQTNQRGNNPKSKKQDIKINNNKRERKIIPNLKLSDKQRMRNYKTNIAPRTRDKQIHEEDDGLISKIREALGLKNPKEKTNLMEDVTVHQAPEYIPPSEARIQGTVVGAGGRIPARLRVGGSRGAREEGAGVFASTRSRTDEIGSTPSEDIESIYSVLKTFSSFMVGSSKADEVEDISKEEREALTGSILTDMPIEEVFDDEDYVLELARATLTPEEFNEYLKYEKPYEYNGLQLAQAKMRLLTKRHSVLPPTDPKYDLRTRKPIAVDKDNEIVREKAASTIQRALTHGKRGKDKASRVRRTAGELIAHKTISDILDKIPYK